MGWSSCCGRFRPCDREQERGLFQCFHVVFQAAVKRKKIANLKLLDPIFGKVNTDLALNRLDRNGPLGAVVAHIASRLHPNQNDAELAVFDECFRTSAGLSLPGWSLLELLKLTADVAPDYFVGQLRETSQTCLMATHGKRLLTVLFLGVQPPFHRSSWRRSTDRF